MLLVGVGCRTATALSGSGQFWVLCLLAGAVMHAKSLQMLPEEGANLAVVSVVRV